MDPIRKKGSNDIAPRRGGNTLDLTKAGSKPSAPKRPYTPEIKSPEPKPLPSRKPVHAAEVAEALDMEIPEEVQAPEPVSIGQRRFWPAFWKFVALLIVLGTIIAGGIYVYMKYYTQQ